MFQWELKELPKEPECKGGSGEETEALEDMGWGKWWRDRVMSELDRLDANQRSLLARVNRIDKESSIDINKLKMLSRNQGVLWGSVTAVVVAILTYVIENPEKIVHLVVVLGSI